MGKSLKFILLTAFVLRLVVAPTTQHPDVIDNLNWGRFLVSQGFTDFYRQDIPDAGPPNYPPLYFIINYTNHLVYENVRAFLWQLNISVSIFPSKLYLWFESQAGNLFFNKLPPIIADIGIGFVIYKIVELVKNTASAARAAAVYLFLPASWYLSAVWGQTDSLFIFFVACATYALLVQNKKLTAVFYLLSLLIKPISIFVAPVIAIGYFKNVKPKDIFYTTLAVVTILVVCALPFLEQVGLRQITELYKNNVREVTGYLTANAFNVWSLLYGFVPVSDSIKIAGFAAYRWGELLFLAIIVMTVIKVRFKEKTTVLLAMLVLSLGAFCFMTKMHERYYYLTYLLFTIYAFFDPRVKKLFYLASVVFFANLYHFWWMPKVGLLVEFLSQDVVEKSLAIFNIAAFVLLFRNYLQPSSKS